MIWKLLKLEIFKKTRFRGLKSFSDYFILFFLAVLFFVAVFFMSRAADTVRRIRLTEEYAVFGAALAAVFVFASALGMILREVLLSPAHDFYAKLPVRRADLLAARLLVIFLKNLVSAALILFFTAGLAYSKADFPPSAYLRLALITLCTTVSAVGLSLLLTVPLAIFYLKLKRFLSLRLLLAGALIAAVFYVMNGAVSLMISLYSGDYGSYFDPARTAHLVAIIERLKILPAARAVSASPLIMIIVSVAAVASATAFALTLYPAQEQYVRDLYTGAPASKKAVRILPPLPFFFSQLRKEFFTVFRNPDSFIPAIAIPLAAPALVNETARVVYAAAGSQVGSGIFLPAYLASYLLYAAIINSFAATSYSRDGAFFDHSAVLPFSRLAAMYAKFCFHLLLVAVPLGLSLAVDSKSGAGFRAIIFADVILFSAGQIFISLISDFRRKKQSGYSGLLSENKNTFYSLTLSFLIAALTCIIALLTNFLGKNGAAYSLILPAVWCAAAGILAATARRKRV